MNALALGAASAVVAALSMFILGIFSVFGIYTGAVDALTTDRPYRQASSRIEALDILDVNASTYFDPKLLEIFHEVILTRPIFSE